VYRRINLKDECEVSIFPEFEKACQYIRENLKKTNVFVHCQAGVSRSASIVIAFLMKEKKMKREEARAFVKSKREKICPNSKFWSELQLWERYLRC
jgi:protein-tyrosine phosphatase